MKTEVHVTRAEFLDLLHSIQELFEDQLETECLEELEEEFIPLCEKNLDDYFRGNVRIPMDMEALIAVYEDMDSVEQASIREYFAEQHLDDLAESGESWRIEEFVHNWLPGDLDILESRLEQAVRGAENSPYDRWRLNQILESTGALDLLRKAS